MGQVESESEQHLAFQRQLFLTCEKYLDTGYGFCPFEKEDASRLLMRILAGWAEEAGWTVPVLCVMPNHVHFLGGKRSDEALGLKEFVKRFKGRSSRELNLLLGRSGAFWHPDWFDRWMRTDAECERVAKYILNNPVKAGLVSRIEDYAFLKGGADAG